MPNFIELDKMEENKEWRLPENVIRFSNTNSNDSFLRICREKEITPHPAQDESGSYSLFY